MFLFAFHCLFGWKPVIPSCPLCHVFLAKIIPAHQGVSIGWVFKLLTVGAREIPFEPLSWCWICIPIRVGAASKFLTLPNARYPLVMTNSLLLKMAIEILDLPIDSMAIFNIYVSLPEGRYFGGFWDSSHSSSIPLWMWAGQFKATCHPNSSGILMPIAFGTKAFTGSLRCISTSYHVSWLKSPFYWLCLFMFPCVSQDSNFPSWIPPWCFGTPTLRWGQGEDGGEGPPTHNGPVSICCLCQGCSCIVCIDHPLGKLCWTIYECQVIRHDVLRCKNGG